MSYSYSFREEATREFAEAYIWYEEQKEGLGKTFKASILAKLNQVVNNPLHYAKSYKNFHQALANKFSFLIVYTIDEKDKHVTVIAIFHTSRNPKKKIR